MSLLLHLVDAGRATGPLTMATVAESLDAAPSGRTRVLLLGGETLARMAARAGLPHADRMGVPCGRPWLALPALHRRLRGYGPIDLVHCWSPGALWLARVALPGVPIVWTVQDPVDGQAAAALPGLSGNGSTPAARRWRWHLIQAYRRAALRPPGPRATHLPPVTVLANDAWTRQRLQLQAATTLEPPLDPARLSRNRAQVRQQWNIDEQVTAVALLSEPAPAADALQAILAAGQVLEMQHSQGRSDFAMRLIVHPRQCRRALAHKTVAAFGTPAFLVQDRRIAAPWSVLGACDAALALGRGGGAALWAMVAGVPLIAEPDASVAAYAQHEETALLARANDHRSLTHQLWRFTQDPQGARDMARRAQARVSCRRDPHAYRRRLAEHYRNATAG